jgi:y4mF family transcriptional regulator
LINKLSEREDFKMTDIKSIDDIAKWVKLERKCQGLTQKQLSGLVGVSERFIVELEKGKPTAEIGKVLHVLKNLGAKIQIKTRGEW